MQCLIDVDHDESYEVLLNKIVHARNPYKCGECRATIQKGERHEYYKGVFDGLIYTHRTCLTCVGIRKKIMCGWTFEGMYEDIHDAIDENPLLADCILMNVNRSEFEKLDANIGILTYWDDDEE